MNKQEKFAPFNGDKDIFQNGEPIPGENTRNYIEAQPEPASGAQTEDEFGVSPTKKITIKEIEKIMLSRNSSLKKLGLAWVIVALVWVLIAIYENSLEGVLIFVAAAIVGLVVFIVKSYVIAKIKKRKYYFTVEECTGKYISQTKAYCLVFRGGQKHIVARGESRYLRSIECEAFGSAYIGRLYYALRLSGRRILYVMPADLAEFVPGDFEKRNGRIYPQKTAGVSAGDKEKHNEGES